MIGKACAGPRHGLPVDLTLVVGDVDAVDGKGVGPCDARMGFGVALCGVIIVPTRCKHPNQNQTGKDWQYLTERMDAGGTMQAGHGDTHSTI